MRSGGKSRCRLWPRVKKHSATSAAAPAPSMRTVATAPRPGGVSTLARTLDGIDPAMGDAITDHEAGAMAQSLRYNPLCQYGLLCQYGQHSSSAAEPQR